jgi:glycosyltransferase 2 family protein
VSHDGGPLPEGDEPLADGGEPLPDRGRRGRSALLQVARVVALVVVVAFAVYALVKGWDGVKASLLDLGWARIALTLVVLTVSTWFQFIAWRRTLDALDAPRIDLVPSSAIFFSSQAAKYVPGSVWPVVIQSEMGRRYDVPRRSMLASYAYTLLQSVAVAGVLSVLALLGPRAGWSSLAAVGATVGGVTLVVALRFPRRFHSLLDLAFRKMSKGETAGSTVDPRLLARGRWWAAGGWILSGVAAWLLAEPLGARLADAPYVVGVSALAWVVGLVVIVLPAGAGVRELVLVLTLGQLIGSTEALTVALVSRFLLIVVDLALAGLVGLPYHLTVRKAGNGGGADVGRVT